ncbi:YhdP family protein [Rheinheimera baltica]|uniref:YhdP family protein n=1 Tax=Rheinheimera baltica TaxID=67576 RepID=UPI00273E3620|nr:YhdP family protein [Rheinheimera baltica]MDP5142609.1 YhdP family protein [Rheinheimera baltica]
MQKAKRVCFYCLHKLWLALAVMLVLLAVLISVLRYSLPYADDYKHYIEQLISDRYGAQVQISELSAGWQKYGPALLLKDISLYNTEQQLQLSISETRVRLDFWRSVLNRQLTAQHFELSGLRYYVDADSVLGNEQQNSLDTAPVLAALETLFFQQLAYFSVVDSQLVLQNDNATDLVLNIKQLDWANSGNRHQGFGELSLAGVTANTLSFTLDLYGAKLADAFGQLYLESERLDVLPWFANVLPPSQKLQQASINFKAWGRIDGGLLRRFQVELADNSVSWQRDNELHQLRLGQGQLLWEPTAFGWSLYSGALTLAAEQEQWQDLQLQLHYQNGAWLGSLDNFRLEAVTPLANLLADDIALLHRLVAFHPRGHLQQLQWHINEQQWQLAGQFDALESQPQGDIPGISGIAGQFWLSDTVSKLVLQGQQGELRWDGLFTQPTVYSNLDATLYVQPVAEQWRFSVPSLRLTSPELQLDASFQWDERLQILARVQNVDAANIEQYLPQRYMPATVRQYLEPAIRQGNVTNATVLWHGAPSGFPYHEQQGVFQVDAELDQGEFAFAPDWPAIEQLKAQLWFENAAMQIDAESGELASVSLQGGVTAKIADLFHADTLDIQIKQQLPAQAVTDLILQSPLQHNLGKTLQHLGLNGEVQGDVTLAIGLKQRSVLASGEVSFDQLSLALQAPDMQLNQVGGKVSFRNEQIHADNLTLQWRGLPLTAALNGEQVDDAYQLALQVQGKQQAKPLLQALYAPAADLVDGTTDWQLNVALALPQQGFSYSAELTSALTDTALLLPAPFSKAADKAAALTITAKGDAAQSVIAAHYDQQLHFHAELQHDSQQFSRVHLIAAEQDTGINSTGFNISIDLAKLDFLPWLDVLQQQLAVSPTAEKPLFPPLAQVRGKLRQLGVAPGVILNNTVFELNQQPQQWQLQLNGTEVASQWMFSKDWQGQGITAKLDYLHLPLPLAAVVDDATDGLVLTPEVQRWMLQLPPLTVSCTDCAIGSYQFGQVQAQAHSVDDKWLLTDFTAKYKRNQLTASGYWQDDDALGVSQFSGKLTSNNLGAMLDEYQITSAIAGSAADINFALNWTGAPSQFELRHLAGNIDYRLDEGSLTEVSDKGARLFSIFSLDSLLRKLKLDFRDVFSKGFFYNNMTGNLALSQGVVQTSDAAVDGVPGSLNIQGYADLVSKKMDYQMAFSPKVTSSLPVIIAWMVNPATGLAALALDEMFQSAEVISKINFTVTGSFDQPVVTEVNRHSKEVPVPVRVAQPELTIEQPDNDSPEPARNLPHG